MHVCRHATNTNTCRPIARSLVSHTRDTVHAASSSIFHSSICIHVMGLLAIYWLDSRLRHIQSVQQDTVDIF